MKKLHIASVLSVLSLLAFCGNAQAQDEVKFATFGGVELWSKPVDIGRTDYLATIVEARTVDPSGSLVTFTNIEISGEVAQLWNNFDLPAANPDTGLLEKYALGPVAAGPLYGEGWSDVDTHLLITSDMIAGGVYKVLESNDQSLGNAGFDPLQSTAAAVAGIGPLKNEEGTNAFFVLPEFQTNAIDFAYIVTPAAAAAAGDGDVQIKVGFLGSGITDAGDASGGGAEFGYGNNPAAISVPMTVPEPSTGMMALVCGLGLLGLRRRKG